MDAHELVKAAKAMAAENGGQPPTKAEFEARVVGAHYHIPKLFGNYSNFLRAAGLESYSERRSGGRVQLPGASSQKLVRAYQKLCTKREQIEGFFRSTVDLAELFERAGNPPVLKLSAQPDTHVKFVDRPAFDSYLAFLRYYKPHIHLIMGDFVDCEGLSHWPAEDLEPRRIVPEMKQARAMLQELVDATPDAVARAYLTGNHEAWIEQAFTKMPELFDGLAELDIEISLRTLLGLDKFGYDLFPLNELLQIGRAHFTHGIYTGQNHAKKHLDTFKTSIYYAHLHDSQEHNQTSVDGPMEAACLMCLCRKDAKFLKGKPNNWVHGHGVFEFFPDGTYSFYKLRIHNGRLAYNGQIFTG